VPDLPAVSPVAIAACLWVLAATVTAMLPMRLQRIVGLPLIAGAIAVIWLLWRDFGPLAGGVALAAVLSMFRRPLMALARYVMGRGR